MLIVLIAELLNESLHARKGCDGLTTLETQLYSLWGKELIRHFSYAKCLWRRKWSGFLHYNGITPTTYRTEALTQANATYLRVSRKHTKAYVGATKTNMIIRDAARRRKHSLRTCYNVEPSIRWWKQTRSYHQFCSIVVQTFPTTTAAFQLETAIQKMRQPDLNAPQIWRHMRAKRHTLPKVAQAIVFPKTTGSSLTRLNWIQQIPTRWSATNTQRIWMILGELSQKGQESGEIMRQLMAPHIQSEDIYALVKQASTVDEPYRSFIRGKLKVVLRHRGLLLPQPESPLTTGLLRHVHHKANILQFLEYLIKKCKPAALPYHAPTGKVVEARWPTIAQRLHNHKGWLVKYKPKGLTHALLSGNDRKRQLRNNQQNDTVQNSAFSCHSRENHDATKQ